MKPEHSVARRKYDCFRGSASIRGYMKHQAATLLLWLIAIVVTFVTVRDSRVLMIVGPVYAVCMIGSLVTVRAALRQSESAT